MYMIARSGSAVLAAVVCTLSAFAQDLRLPSILSDHMVVQADVPLRIWGWASPGENITVQFAGQTVTAHAAPDGRWQAALDPIARPERAGDGATMMVRGDDDTITVSDILIGEVWICSGQSNMQWTVNASDRADEFTREANYPDIRMFMVPHIAEHQPQDDVAGRWVVCSPETVGAFSAVGYHFGRILYNELGGSTAVGLVNSSWGGSSVEAWTSRPVLDQIADAQPFLAAYDAMRAADDVNIAPLLAIDADGADFEAAELPATFASLGHDMDGMILFRRVVEIPQMWAGRALAVSLGAIDDNDVTFFNGERIGATNNWQALREYTIAADDVRGGKAVLAVRIEDTGGVGGFTGAAEAMTIGPVDDAGDRQSLAGKWQMRVLGARRNVPPNHRPANLYNGMIYPLRHYAVRGAIWYQGESNANGNRGMEYFTIFPAMILNWRETFANPDMPFYFVQLPNFTNNEPNTPWRYPLLRAAQLYTLQNVPNTGMAVTLELGDANDIHPRNKHDVGDRLARWALADVYGFDDIVKSGPLYTDATFMDDGRVRVRFDLFGSALAARGGGLEVGGFELAGPDAEFHPAKAIIGGSHVDVSCDAVPHPVALRYAWKNNADDATLVNEAGLPASPFMANRGDE